MISRDGEEAFGSGRSIRAFHLLEAIESCSTLFSRYGGHSHACGFAMPSANVAELRARLDAFARARLTPADFDPILDLDAELDLADVTPELFQALQLLEPYGMGNPEPVFAARGVQLTAPPRILKDKHVKLKLRAGAIDRRAQICGERLRGTLRSCRFWRLRAAIPTAPPSGATKKRPRWRKAIERRQLRTENRELRTKITFDALGWHMAERLQQTPLLAGDTIDVAFTIGNNDHPEYGGLELSLRDFQIPVR